MFALAAHNSIEHTQITFTDRIDIGSAPPMMMGESGLSSPPSLAIDDGTMLAWHARIECIGAEQDRKIRLTALGELTVRDELIEADSEIDLRLPLQIRIGNTSLHLFEIEKRARFEGVLSFLDCSRANDLELPLAEDQVGKPPSATTLNDWFRSLSVLQRQASGSPAFFDVAASAIVNPGGLDAGMVLIREGAEWSIRSSCIPHAPIGITFHPGLLEEMLETKRTVFHSAESVNGQRTQGGTQGSLIESVVAAPLFNAGDEIVGAIYGCRNTQSENQRSGIRSLEAQWIRLLAEAVSGGIIRLSTEAEAARTRVLFEQVFSPKIVAELEQNPKILQGHQREITVLFADLRGFTSTSEQLGPARTFKLLGEVMNVLTDAIHSFDGVVIDYYGDGLCAMWNAPASQPDHATLACRAALKMQEMLPKIASQWSRRLPQELRLGIGIHTGTAQVGNAGSRSRLKYGPRGPMVNLASRLETATKSLSESGDGIVISSETNRHAVAISTTQIPDLTLRGVADPVEAYWLTGESGAAPGTDARPSEFSQLTQAEQPISGPRKCETAR